MLRVPACIQFSCDDLAALLFHQVNEWIQHAGRLIECVAAFPAEIEVLIEFFSEEVITRPSA